MTRPLGDCFAVAMRLAMKLSESGVPVEVVHGMADGEDKRFAHAWVEFAGRVYDKSNGNNILMEASRYYERFNVSDTVRYSSEEAMIKMVREKHMGPWESKLEEMNGGR